MTAKVPTDTAEMTEIQLHDQPPGELKNLSYDAAPPGEYSRDFVADDVKEGQSLRNRKKKEKAEDAALNRQQLQYSVQDIPPWYLSIILGLQHYLIMFGATVTNPLVMSKFLCIGEKDNLVKSELIGTIFFVSGICTLLQTTLGTRLPIIQGGTFTFVTPSIAILSLDKWKCPQPSFTPPVVGENLTTATAAFSGNVSTEDDEDIWKPRIREIQGAIMVASLAQVLIGLTGIMGFMLRFIGPLAIAPTISLAGLSLFNTAASFAAKQWWITMVTIVLIALFSQYLTNVAIPCFRYQRGGGGGGGGAGAGGGGGGGRGGCIRTSFPLFRLFPVILAISLTWALCAILTAAGVFPGNPNADVIQKAAWFRFPYPGQWGVPTVSAASVFGMLSGVLASMVESVGDYYACARMSSVPPPPMHAVNRGIAVEGVGCILAGAWGSGTGTTSYSENVGAIGITKVASRRVIQVGAAIMMIFGVFGKFGALFVTIPDPIIGGVFIVMFGMITAVGISNLQFVDLNSSRNLFIIGFSFFFGLTLSQYIAQNPGIIKTGSLPFDQIFTVLLQTSMFVGGFAGFLLDNTIPGTNEERGLIKWREMLHTAVVEGEGEGEGGGDRDKEERAKEEEEEAIYDIPLVTPFLRRRRRWTRFAPFLPTFDETLFSFDRCRKTHKYKTKQSESNRQP